jgi:hypothetical protein
MGGRPMGSRVPPFNQMRNRMTSKPAAAAFIIAASLAVPATAHADDAVPTVDEVVAVLARLTDPNIPAIEKNDVVTPGFSPDDAATIDTHLQRLSAAGIVPLNFVVTDIQPAPDNSAGATARTMGSFRQSSVPGPIALHRENGRWPLIHQSAASVINVIWHNGTRYIAPFTK